ncbi:MAG TPA: hypothetical protein VG387_15300 [Rhizomicrobium sp.]|jgi:hypothetical protein|nr:hypothetical protein [Rhizomicrobium sp.]
MSLSPPSHDYRRAVQELQLGSAWRTDQEELGAFATAFSSLSAAAYTESLPKRRRNGLGEDFSYEFQYLSGVLFPNAHAFSGSDGRLFVGITASMYGLVNQVCDQLFEDDAISRLLDEKLEVVTARKRRLTMEFADMGQKRSAIFSNYVVDDEFIAAAPPSGWRTSYRSVGDFSIAVSDKYRVRDAILSYIFHHEMGHLIEGHVGLQSRQEGAGVLGESGDGSLDPTQLRLAMEFQADRSAAKALLLVSHARHAIAGRAGIENNWNRSVSLDFLSIFLAHTILTMSAMAEGRISKGGDLSDSEVKDIFHQNTSYPSAGIRMISALNTYVNSLDAIDPLVKEDIDSKDTRLMRPMDVVKHLGDTYGEFAMMLVIARIHEDDFQAGRKAIFEEGSIDRLRRECAPYAFGGLV